MRSGAMWLPIDVRMNFCFPGILFYFGCPVEPFSLPIPVSDDVGDERVSGAGFAGWYTFGWLEEPAGCAIPCDMPVV